jgi:hypothetical protein
MFRFAVACQTTYQVQHWRESHKIPLLWILVCRTDSTTKRNQPPVTMAGTSPQASVRDNRACCTLNMYACLRSTFWKGDSDKSWLDPSRTTFETRSIRAAPWSTVVAQVRPALHGLDGLLILLSGTSTPPQVIIYSTTNKIMGLLLLPLDRSRTSDRCRCRGVAAPKGPFGVTTWQEPTTARLRDKNKPVDPALACDSPEALGPGQVANGPSEPAFLVAVPNGAISCPSAPHTNTS